MDIDGEPLTYEVSLDDEVAANAWVTTKGLLKFVASYKGGYEVTVRAYDGKGYSKNSLSLLMQMITVRFKIKDIHRFKMS